MCSLSGQVRRGSRISRPLPGLSEHAVGWEIAVAAVETCRKPAAPTVGKEVDEVGLGDMCEVVPTGRTTGRESFEKLPLPPLGTAAAWRTWARVADLTD